MPTIRTLSDLLTRFADNTTGNITAGDEQDWLVSLVCLIGGEVSITGAVTATADQMNFCTDSATPADYTITLPAPSVGSTIGVMLDPAMSKLVTVDAGAGNNINGKSTTLSAAITSTTATSITVTSAAGFPPWAFIITVDSEQMLVTGGQGTTTWTVIRGYNKTTAAVHNNGVSVDWGRLRILWADESLFLYGDGSRWKKYYGRTIPMTFHGSRSLTTQTLSTSGTWAPIKLDTQDLKYPCPPAMWDATDGAAKALRPGMYSFKAFVYAGGTSAIYLDAGINNTNISEYNQLPNLSSAAAAGTNGLDLLLATGDIVNPFVDPISGSVLINGTGNAAPAHMYLTEIPRF